ncbi:hypothetical protein GEMRC1_009216 [Eukaryota sp. GEM-RC1]
MRHLGLCLIFTLLSICSVLAETDYVPPTPAGEFSFFDSFSDLDKWIVSSNPKFGGKWSVEYAQEPAGIPHEKGLVIKTAAAHHAIFTNLEQPLVLSEEPLVFQYEVRYQKHPISCAGTYMKLLRSSPNESDFTADTPYTVMFGPDVCGSSKVHFIFKSLNPVTNEYDEHHLVNPHPFKTTVSPTSIPSWSTPKPTSFQSRLMTRLSPLEIS